MVDTSTVGETDRQNIEQPREGAAYRSGDRDRRWSRVGPVPGSAGRRLPGARYGVPPIRPGLTEVSAAARIDRRDHGVSHGHLSTVRSRPWYLYVTSPCRSASIHITAVTNRHLIARYSYVQGECSCCVAPHNMKGAILWGAWYQLRRARPDVRKCPEGRPGWVGEGWGGVPGGDVPRSGAAVLIPEPAH